MSLVSLRPFWMTNHPPSVLWQCWLGHQTCKNRRPYNLYCVGADVKPCSINLRTLLTWFCYVSFCVWYKLKSRSAVGRRGRRAPNPSVDGSRQSTRRQFQDSNTRSGWVWSTGRPSMFCLQGFSHTCSTISLSNSARIVVVIKVA